MLRHTTPDSAQINYVRLVDDSLRHAITMLVVLLNRLPELFCTCRVSAIFGMARIRHRNLDLRPIWSWNLNSVFFPSLDDFPLLSL